jgi:integrase
MRLGELLALRWCDVDFVTGLVAVGRSVEDTEAHGLRIKLPKSGKVRTVSVPLSIWAELRKLQRQQKAAWFQLCIRPLVEEEALIFPASVDRPDDLLRPRVASQRFIDARDDFGLAGFRFHDLRHQHISILLRTLSLPEVAARAGHANPAVTARIYAHTLQDGHQRGADAVAVMLAKRLRSA